MKKLAPILVLTAGILWGLIGLFVRRLSAAGFGSMEVVAVRAIVTSILLLFYLSCFDRKCLRVRLRDLWCFVGTGIFSIVFFNFCYFSAITLTSLSVAAILLYTAPAFVMVFSAFLFREKITKRKLLALLATFIGCVLVSGGISTDDGLHIYGILVGLGAGLGYALYSIFSRFALQRGYSSLTITFYTFLFAILGAVPLSDGKFLWSTLTKQPGTLLFCMIFGLVSTVIPYLVYTKGLSKMENGTASIIASIEPVTATILGFVMYGEPISLIHLIGVILILSGMLCSL